MTLINAGLYPDYAKFINTLRCPLCDSQLDGNCHPNGSQLYCVSDNEEYKCGWLFGVDEPTYESIKHTFSQYQYSIDGRRVSPGIYDTVITRVNMDYAPNLRYKSRVEVFRMTGSRLLFFRSPMDEKTFMTKLKLYNIFS